MDGRREISIARGTGRVSTRVADAFVGFARERAATLGRGLGLPPAEARDASARP
jgi:hypothetical protein